MSFHVKDEKQRTGDMTNFTIVIIMRADRGGGAVHVNFLNQFTSIYSA